jgi:2-methylcitrate dehydratase PrpD
MVTAVASENDDVSPTQLLANYITSARPEDLPAVMRREDVRTLFNWIACAVGGSRHETIEIAIAALGSYCEPPQATVLGRTERFDIPHRKLLNGIRSHIFPVAAAVLALAEYRLER